ncbi:hypothetical protein [Ferruginibacter sp. HRS2-29]|uniref:hypothetical protein n=1 Tax=Ferruginibacter sp. HRS2-29 TaxID=2487334 RepID=UPI0020CEB78E|nr:hypothetical protein [Ferruginibacter sp. HRS2-29]MCP9751138.1 hypothetical protein [Ferruginibacter sp. HRS2-29]
MKLFFSIILSTTILFTQAQSQSVNKPQQIEAATSAIPSVKVAAQAGNWKQQVKLTPADANAWFNYYNWVDRDKALSGTEKAKELKEALSTSRQYIVGTWQYSLMIFLQSGKKDSAALSDALRLAEDKTAVYPYAAQLAIIKENRQSLREYCLLINKAAPMPKSKYEYHYNTLMSAEQNGIIYAKGLNDLVPLAILQQVYGIRPDIGLKYYDNTVSTDAYLCLSLGKEILEKYPDALYTGLLIRTKKAQNFSLEKIFENFSFQYLDAVNFLDEEDRLIYRNYLPSLIIQYKNYLENNDPKASASKSRIDHLAMLTGTTEMVKNLLNR